MTRKNQLKDKSNQLPTGIVITSLLACVVCVTAMAIGTTGTDSILHSLMAHALGPYLIIFCSFASVYITAQLPGFDMALDENDEEGE